MKQNPSFNILTDNQKAIIATMKLFPDQTLQYVLMPVETVSLDDKVVELFLKDKDLILDIMNRFYNEHGQCIDLTANIEAIEILMESINGMLFYCLDMCKEDMGFECDSEIFDITDNDEQFAKYVIDVKDTFEKDSFIINPVVKNSDIFTYAYWTSVIVDNFIHAGFEMELRDEKYW